MQSKAKNVVEYLKQVPEERKHCFNKLRETILPNLPEGFVEQINFGKIGYVVPLSLYPSGYHTSPRSPLPFVSIASQKKYIALYHMGIYANPKLLDWFVAEYPKHCKLKLDMGKSCVRLKKMDDIPYELIGELMQKMSAEDWIKCMKKI